MASLLAGFNSERLFNFDFTVFEDMPKEERYKSLKDLYEENGEDEVYTLRAIFVGSASEFYEESPLATIDECYVNLPQFQLRDVKAMLDSKAVIKAINDGKAGFKIETYEMVREKKKRTYYKAVWVDLK